MVVRQVVRCQLWRSRLKNHFVFLSVCWKIISLFLKNHSDFLRRFFNLCWKIISKKGCTFHHSFKLASTDFVIRVKSTAIDTSRWTSGVRVNFNIHRVKVGWSIPSLRQSTPSGDVASLTDWRNLVRFNKNYFNKNWTKWIFFVY